MEFGSVVLLLGALVIAGVVQACATGRIGPNAIAGIRLPSVMVSTQTWQAGHAAAAIPTWVTSGIAALFGGSSQAEIGMYVLIGAGILLLGSVWGAVVAHRAAVRVPAKSARRPRR